MERFFQASKRQVPPFSAKSVNLTVNLPPVQSTLVSSHHPELSSVRQENSDFGAQGTENYDS